MAKELELKADVLKSMIDFFKGEDRKSWSQVLDPSDESETDDEEYKEKKECSCGKPFCKICNKSKVVTEE